jgi:cytochrome c oxidase cbb3-type subunit 4
MDINFLRSAVTLIGLLLFLGLVVWTWQRSRRQAFDEAARLPFIDDEAHLQDSNDQSRRAP